MNNRPMDLHELTGAYVLHALPSDERDRFVRHLEDCPSCAREVAELRAATAALGGLAEIPPPPALRDRVLAAIERTPQEPAAEQTPPGPAVAPVDDADPAAAGSAVEPGAAVVDLDARRLGRRPARWAVAAAAVAAAALVAVVGMAIVIGDLQDRAQEAELASAQLEEILAAPDVMTVTAPGPGDAHGRVVAAPSLGQAVFVSSGMEPAPHAHTYELWLIDDDGPAPAGLFDPDDHGRVMHMLEGDLVATAAIGVTIEPEGGSPEPTTDPVMVFEMG